jgi:hypothetical protein
VRTARYCRVCGKAVYRGERYTWSRGGYERQDEDGEYYDGCGECEVCGAILCSECADFDREGVCADCRGEQADDDAGDDE